MDLENGALNPKDNPSPMSLKPLRKKDPWCSRSGATFPDGLSF
jgi:hypothetical protein